MSGRLHQANATDENLHQPTTPVGFERIVCLKARVATRLLGSDVDGVVRVVQDRVHGVPGCSGIVDGRWRSNGGSFLIHYERNMAEYHISI